MRVYPMDKALFTLSMVLALSTLAVGGLFWGLGVGSPAMPVAAQATCARYVLGIDAGDQGDCSDAAHPCRTVQYAVQQAAPGDRICVAKHILAGPLTYTGTVEITQSLTLDGAWDAMCVDPNNLTCSFQSIPCDPANVTLDAEGNGRVISISGNINGAGIITPVIECLTITGGDAAGLGGSPGSSVDNDAGGGIYSRDAAPIIVNNVITGNYGCSKCPVSYGRGGGVYLLNAPVTAVISNNVIAHNVADDSTWGQGGGLMLWHSDAQVLSNTVMHNRAGLSAGDGGGIRVVEGQPTLADNVIASNVAGQQVMGNGGGIFVKSSTPVTIARNHIHNNYAINGAGDAMLRSHGGGIYGAGETSGGVLLIYDNVIHHNIASPLTPQSGEGGGLYLYDLLAPSIVQNNVIYDNIGGHNDSGTGGGVYVRDSVLSIEDNAIYDNAASWSGDFGSGGGIGVVGGQVLVARNAITSNHAVYFTGPPNEDCVGQGGGIYITRTTAITLRDNVIADNIAATQGGGLYLTLLDNAVSQRDKFSRNTADDGGAAYVITTSVYFAEADFYSNTAESGGGLYVKHGYALTVANSRFRKNAATYGAGGGSFVYSGSALIFADNLFWDNDADAYGGGLYAQAASALTVSGGDFSGNTAPGGGSAFYGLFGDALRFVGNTVHENAGVGVEFHESDAWLDNNIVVVHETGIKATGGVARMRHNTLANNKTGMLLDGWWASDGVAVLTNTILAGNTVGITATAGQTATLEGTLWGAGTSSNAQDWGGAGLILTGTVNVYGDPAFVAPTSGDYHIMDTSAAIDAGVSTDLDHDIDGDTRPIQAGYDLGADEYMIRCFLPLVMRQ